MKIKNGVCPTCNRSTHLSFHHFMPRKVHRRSYFKKNFSKTELNEGVSLCNQCHRAVHKFYDEMHLAKHLNSLELLQSNEELTKHFEWLAKQKIRQI